MNLKNIKNKIGCSNQNLKGLEHLSGGHYVYIRKVNYNGTCDVNVVTSLEDSNKNIIGSRIRQLRKGNTYSIPKCDANFTRWSGINKTPIKNVKIINILDIGSKVIKKRHYFYIDKFMK